MPGIKSEVLILMEYQTQREPSHMFEGEQRNWGSSLIVGTTGYLQMQEITNAATYLCYATVGSLIGFFFTTNNFIYLY
jgi:hypothetical protein